MARLPAATTTHRLALAVFQGKLYVAWTDARRVVWMAASADGKQFDGPIWIVDTASEHGPALVACQDRLYLAWTDQDTGRLFLRWSDDGRTFRERDWVAFDEMSTNGPALAARDEPALLYVAWTGKGNGYLNLLTFDGATRSPTRTLGATSDYRSRQDPGPPMGCALGEWGKALPPRVRALGAPVPVSARARRRRGAWDGYTTSAMSRLAGPASGWWVATRHPASSSHSLTSATL